MDSVFYIAAGGAIGAITRYGVMHSITRITGMAFPYGTLAVNIVGSLAMGMLIGWLTKHGNILGIQNSTTHLFLAVGVLGSFTTFSTFSLDIVTLLQRGETMLMMAYIVTSVLLSVVALFVGLMVMR